MWKHLQLLGKPMKSALRFSPLAGIRYVETFRVRQGRQFYHYCFSPLAGIRYVETKLLVSGKNK